MDHFTIDYTQILARAQIHSIEEAIQFLSDALPTDWCDQYCKMTLTKTNILQFNDGGFEFLFDFSSELISQGVVSAAEATEDRVVAVFGTSKASHNKRDATRMKGFLGGPLKSSASKSLDKGHFMGHALGGGLDANLFPQMREINRGWSERGKVYRSMERYCSNHPGTFCFSRPIYRDQSWTPVIVEYGVLTDNKTLWVERFEN